MRSSKKKTAHISALPMSIGVFGFLMTLRAEILKSIKIETLWGLDLNVISIIVVSILAIISYWLIYRFISLDRSDSSISYFEPISFDKPTDDLIRKAVNEVLNSEKSQPYFVYVAPVPDEVNLLLKKLENSNFVWENGSPGTGKSMLAYHALFLLRRRIKLFKNYSVRIPWLRYKPYRLNVNKLEDTADFTEVVDQLHELKGKKRKVVLIDDAHKLNAETKLNEIFQKIASKGSSGKFIWINTNYMNVPENDSAENIQLDFKQFYPKLLKELYSSDHPIISEVVNQRCSGLNVAKKGAEKGEIKDPWHFNFIATQGEQRIVKQLNKLYDNKLKQDVLLLTIFIFSARNLIFGEKTITFSSFVQLLNEVSLPIFKKQIDENDLEEIIDTLAKQEKGRLILITNYSSLDRGYLSALHIRISIAIVNSITTFKVINDRKLIFQMIQITSQLLLSNNYKECRYFGGYFSLLSTFQADFIKENDRWIKEFLTHVEIEQLHVYPQLIEIVKKYHKPFFNEFVTDEYVKYIAELLSRSKAIRFSAVQQFIKALSPEFNTTIIDGLDVEALHKEAIKTEARQFHQVAGLIQSLGYKKMKFILLCFSQDSEQQLIEAANKAGLVELDRVAALISVIKPTLYRTNFIGKLNLESFTEKIKHAEVDHFPQIASFIGALEPIEIKNKFLDSINYEVLIKEIVSSKTDNLYKKVTDFFVALKDRKGRIINKIPELVWEKLAKSAGKVKAEHFSQLAGFIKLLEPEAVKTRFVSKIDWKTLSSKANNADILHLEKMRDLVLALGKHAHLFTNDIKPEVLVLFSRQVNINQIIALCVLVFRVKEEDKRQLIIDRVDWIRLLYLIKVSHLRHLRIVTNVLEFQQKKSSQACRPSDYQSVLDFLDREKNGVITQLTRYALFPKNLSIYEKFTAVLLAYDWDFKNQLIEHFSSLLHTMKYISPCHFQSFTKLLLAIREINDQAAVELVSSDTIWKNILLALDDPDLENQLVGLGNLARLVKDINSDRFLLLKDQPAVVNLRLVDDELDKSFT